MKKELAEMLVAAAHQEGDMEVSLYENYSGRGMYGSTTCGVVCYQQKDLLVYSLKYLAYSNAQLSPELLDAINEMTSFSSDSLGQDTIVY